MRRRTARLLTLVIALFCGLTAARSRQRGEPKHGERRGDGAHAREIPPDSVWSGPEACTAALAAGKRLPRAASVARIGAWNVRWFPDGGPGRHPRSGERGLRPTNIGWLACTIAWLGVDVLTLEELKSNPEASGAMVELRERLDRLTGGAWRLELDRCPGAGRQSVGILFDEKRVAASGFRNVDSLNPHGGCEENLRPGLGGYFRFPGGADFHLVAVHLKSGPDRREYELRRASLSGIVSAYREVQSDAPDADVVLAGDFNTMGCPNCRPKIRPDEEIAEMSSTVGGFEVPFRRVASTLECSEYYRGEGTLLDHFVVARAMREVPATARVHVEGYCGELGCERFDSHVPPRAYLELSDHCPVVLDVDDRDVD